jgi:hypothetical protein
VISFTLPLSIPKNGTGLNVWNVSYDDFMKLDQSKKRSLFEQAPDGFIDYKLGHLILHKGHILHQIKAPSLVEEGDLRITLQGHGILADGKIRIYW